MDIQLKGSEEAINLFLKKERLFMKRNGIELVSSKADKAEETTEKKKGNSIFNRNKK